MPIEQRKVSISDHEHPEHDDKEKPWWHEHEVEHWHGVETPQTPTILEKVQAVFPGATVEVKVTFPKDSPKLDRASLDEKGNGLATTEEVGFTVWNGPWDPNEYKPAPQKEPATVSNDSEPGVQSEFGWEIEPEPIAQTEIGLDAEPSTIFSAIGFFLSLS